MADKSPRQILLDGYFQNYSFYKPYRERIRGEWLRLDGQPPLLRPNHIVVSVRLGDFVGKGICLAFSYYSKILEAERYSVIYLVSDQFEHPFIKRFQEFGTVIKLKKDPITTLQLAGQIEKMIMANSTFSWWLAYLSNAERIYFPLPERFEGLGCWGMHRLHELDLRVPSARYSYVEHVPLWGHQKHVNMLGAASGWLHRLVRPRHATTERR